MAPKILFVSPILLFILLIIGCTKEATHLPDRSSINEKPSQAESKHNDVDTFTKRNNSTLAKEVARITGSVAIAEAWGLAIDDHFVYWVDEAEPTTIKAVNLIDPQQIMTVAQGSFPKGIVSDVIVSTNNRWLLFWDRESDYIGGRWKLQAMDRQTNQQKIVLEGSGQPYEAQAIESLAKIWIALGENTLALSYALVPDNQGCQRVVLRVINLEAGKSKIIKEGNCAKDETIWLWPGLSGDSLVAEQDYNATAGGGIDVILYHLQTGEARQLTQDHLSSAPQVSAKFIIWKRAYRSDYGQSIGVYDRQTGESKIVDFPTSFPRPQLNEQWVYWFPESLQSIYVYDLERSTFIQVIDFSCTQFTSHIAMRSSVLAWVRNDTKDPNQIFLEWQDVKELPPSRFVHCNPPPV